MHIGNLAFLRGLGLSVAPNLVTNEIQLLNYVFLDMLCNSHYDN